MNKILQDLVNGVNTLQSSIQALLAKSAGQIDPASVQPVVDQVTALNAQIQVALSPAVVPVAPAQS